ncbi:MAG TPA: GMC family oxidoreductase [Kineosporiaceae bacterium]|nr:GMC family oxidoreductase [Kineosporiaceae bacterium]
MTRREDAGEGEPVRLDHDVVVIGSGFGGSVAALRLAEKGYRVLVVEAGRRFADEDFARTSWQLTRYLWAPRLKCFGIQRIHLLDDVLILAGSGVGGGSLVYANTLYVPPGPFFADRQWSDITDWAAELAPHYAQAKRMLGVVEENPCEGPVEEVMRVAARSLGVGHTVRKTPAGVFFGRDGAREPGVTVPDPYFAGAGPARTGCTECGNCMVGCRIGAKNTLVKNYLALAERLGVRIEALRTVVDLRPLDPADPARGWRIATRRTGAWGRGEPRTITAGQVVLAAGTWGTQTLLHAMKGSGALPRLSDRLGDLTRTNSEALLGAMTRAVPRDVDLTRGVAITTSFHPDEHTHLENVRYGRGSNVMGSLTMLMADGHRDGRRGGHKRAVLRQVLRRPGVLRFLVPPPARRFSERTVIGLVMQPVDNSITVRARRRRLGAGWRLTSVPGHGAPNPAWIPAGHTAIRAVADRLAARTGQPTITGAPITNLFDIPMTAHFIGGCVIGSSPQRGVVDPYHRVWGYPGLHIVDGSALSANLGVNPSLTITAQAERAFAAWPNRGEPDPRPAQGEPYRAVDPVAAGHPALPGGAPG